MLGFGVSGAGVDTVDLSDSYLDPFGRLITVQPIELGSHDHRAGKLPRYWDEQVVGNATSTHNPLTVSVDVTTGTGATDSVLRQTYRCFQYFRGNAQIGKFSLNPGGVGIANNERLWGFGDDQNGVFWGIDGNGLKVIRRSFTSGVTVNHTVYQQNFNLDRLDGTGPSGLNIDLGKQNLFTITYGWLGTADIQLKVAYKGKLVTAHVFESSNIEASAWSRSGSLPIMYSNKNTDVTTAPVTMKICCSSVYTVGSSEETATYGSVSTGTTTISINSTLTCVAAIRLRPDTNYFGIDPAAYDILPIQGTGVAFYRVILRPTLTGAVWANYSDVTQILTAPAGYVAGSGYVIQEGYANLSVQGRNAVEIPARINSTLGYAIDGTPDAIAIVMQTTSGSGQLFFTGAYKEII